MSSKLRSRTGFTLIELMIVVAIIGILASIAIPNFLRFQAKSKQSEARLLLSGIFTSQTSYFSENNRYGSFSEIAWSPIGTKQIYTYYSGSDGAGGSGLADFKDASGARRTHRLGGCSRAGPGHGGDRRIHRGRDRERRHGRDDGYLDGQRSEKSCVHLRRRAVVIRLPATCQLRPATSSP